MHPNRSGRVGVAVISALLLLGLGCRAAGFEGNTYRPMQEDFDRIRLDHLFIIDTLLREYAAKTGSFPFAVGSDSIPTAVVIATPAQAERNSEFTRIRVDSDLRAEGGTVPPVAPRITTRTPDELQAELSRGLGRAVQLPFDPQQVPVNKPSVYIFVLYRGVYDVSAFLHQDFGFARKLGPFHNKVALSNRTLPRYGFWRREDLMREPAFRAFFSAEFNRGGYVMKTTFADPPRAQTAEQMRSDTVDDSIRVKDAETMRALVHEYHDRSGGRLPYEDRATEKPYMVFIGVSVEHEDAMAKTPALQRDGTWGNSHELEAELTRVLGRPIVLPRDPLRTPSYAPNVYLYFITRREYCVVTHLVNPSRISQPYRWDGGTFHSHAVCEEAPARRNQH